MRTRRGRTTGGPSQGCVPRIIRTNRRGRRLGGPPAARLYGSLAQRLTSHAKGYHLPGADAPERMKTAGREGRAWGTPYAVGVGADLFHRWDVVCGIGRDDFGEHRCSRPSANDGVGVRRRQALPGLSFLQARLTILNTNITILKRIKPAKNSNFQYYQER